jgi:hypothetical protein
VGCIICVHTRAVCRYLFGSSANGFGKENSDVDMCIMWTDPRTGMQVGVLYVCMWVCAYVRMWVVGVGVGMCMCMCMRVYMCTWVWVWVRMWVSFVVGVGCVARKPAVML